MATPKKARFYKHAPLPNSLPPKNTKAKRYCDLCNRKHARVEGLTYESDMMLFYFCSPSCKQEWIDGEKDSITPTQLAALLTKKG